MNISEPPIKYHPHDGHELQDSELREAEAYRDPAVGTWLFSPWTGTERLQSDIQFDEWMRTAWAPAPAPDAGIAALRASMLPPAPGVVAPVVPPVDRRKEERRAGVDVTAVLTQRGDRYGVFTGHAHVTQEFKALLRKHLIARGKTLAPDQQEALDMIFHKVGRIVNGDADYDDSWVDIAGYAKLVADRLQGVER